MELNHEEKQLLSYLAKEWQNSGPPGYVETSVLAEQMNLSVEKTKSVIQSLFVKGLVDSDEREHYAAYLTPEGYETAQS
jgi:Mn-dependent DtxR family transcriptional regulator